MWLAKDHSSNESFQITKYTASDKEITATIWAWKGPSLLTVNYDVFHKKLTKWENHPCSENWILMEFEQFKKIARVRLQNSCFFTILRESAWTFTSYFKRRQHWYCKLDCTDDVITVVYRIPHTIMLCLYLTKMLATITLHSQQPTHNYITTEKIRQKRCRNVLILEMAKIGKMQHFEQNFWKKSAFVDKRKITFLVAKFLGA